MAAATQVSPPVISASGTYFPKKEPFWITNPDSTDPDVPIMEGTIHLLSEHAASGRPESVLLGTVSDRRLRVRKAIPLNVSVEEGHVVVSWSDADEFAYGASTGDAIEELSKTIGELYFDLNDQSVPLGKDLARVRDVLNDHIEKVR
jgi:hypothetical protein